MSKVRVAAFALSIDGYGAGPDQSLENPLGRGGPALHEWFFPTRTFAAMHGGSDGETGIDDGFAAASFDNVGAWIIGRNMFGPVRGPWENEDWKGWWGEEPPYHVSVFVLTHHPRPPLPMKGGTTFHFVTGGTGEALALARAAANGKDVRIGGGAQTIRQYLLAGDIDEMHLVVSPVILGNGESLLAGIDLVALGYRVTRSQMSPKAMHLILERA